MCVKPLIGLLKMQSLYTNILNQLVLPSSRMEKLLDLFLIHIKVALNVSYYQLLLHQVS